MLSYRPEYVEAFAPGRGVSYGSLYNYDARVPLCFYGPQFRAAQFEQMVTAVDIAPTLSRALGVAPPSSTTGRVLGRGPRRMTLETSLCGIALRNPVLAASGTFGYGVEFEQQVDLDALGGSSSKACPASPSKATHRRASTRPAAA